MAFPFPYTVEEHDPRNNDAFAEPPSVTNVMRWWQDEPRPTDLPPRVEWAPYAVKLLEVTETAFSFMFHKPRGEFGQPWTVNLTTHRNLIWPWRRKPSLTANWDPVKRPFALLFFTIDLDDDENDLYSRLYLDGHWSYNPPIRSGGTGTGGNGKWPTATGMVPP